MIKPIFISSSALCLMVLLLHGQNDQNYQLKDQFNSEINALTSNATLQKAFALIKKNDDLATKDLVTLTEIPAPPFKETQRAEAFKNMIKDLGIDSIWIDEVGNVIGLR